MPRPKRKTVVVALGGNAILQADEEGTVEQQFKNAQQSVKGIVALIKKGYRVVITHGNGPQVGNLLLMVETLADKIPPLSLNVCGANTQGWIGYMIQQSLMNSLHLEGIDHKVATILTQVVVDKNDPSMKNPTKPVGPFYTKEEGLKLANERGWTVVDDSGRGYRRVVPSPMPLEIVEKEQIKSMLKLNYTLITTGGGGIPVIRKEDGTLEGVDAVIDKDLASAVLAISIDADYFIILTAVEKVCLNFNKPDQKELDEMTVAEAKKYLEEKQFPAGSMGPKIKAAIHFLENSDKTKERGVIISSIEKVVEALKGETGTWIDLGKT